MRNYIGVLLLAAIIYVIIVLFYLSIAHGHEDEQWINDKALSDPISGQFCCGPKDCKPLPDNWVEKVPGGYWVGAEYIPNAKALPFSPDGHYHRCVNAKGETRCFIIPPPSS